MEIDVNNSPIGWGRNMWKFLSIVVQLLSHVQMFVTQWTAACQVSPSFTVSQSFLKLVSVESVMPFSHPILCHPLLFLPSIFPSIRVFSSESALHIRWLKYRSSASVLPMNSQGWFPLGLSGLFESLKSLEGFSRVFSSTTVRKPQFFSTQPSLVSNSHIHTCLLEKQ